MVVIRVSNQNGESEIYGPYKDETEAIGALAGGGWKNKRRGWACWVKLIESKEITAFIHRLCDPADFAKSDALLTKVKSE